MKAFLLHPRKDYELEAQLPPGHEALVQDLGLDTLFEAMAAGDSYVLGVARAVVLGGLRDPDEMVYRQRVLMDCVEHAPASILKNCRLSLL